MGSQQANPRTSSARGVWERRGGEEEEVGSPCMAPNYWMVALRDSSNSSFPRPSTGARVQLCFSPTCMSYFPRCQTSLFLCVCVCVCLCKQNRGLIRYRAAGRTHICTQRDRETNIEHKKRTRLRVPSRRVRRGIISSFASRRTSVVMVVLLLRCCRVAQHSTRQPLTITKTNFRKHPFLVFPW